MEQNIFFALKSDSLDRFEQVERSKTEQIRGFWPYVQATDRPTYERASPSQGLHYYSARYTGNITSYYVATPNFETKRRPFTTQYSVQ